MLNKQKVVGSNPIVRSTYIDLPQPLRWNQMGDGHLSQSMLCLLYICYHDRNNVSQDEGAVAEQQAWRSGLDP